MNNGAKSSIIKSFVISLIPDNGSHFKSELSGVPLSERGFG
jgi:hypothetical protein